MAYKNKTYVAFHYGEKGNMKDGDKNFYHLMDAWKKSDNIDFNFYDAHEITNIMSSSNDDTIRASLQERLRNTKIMLFLLGKNSKERPWVVWELEQAISRGIPLVVVDVTSKSNSINRSLLPDCLISYKFGYTYFEKDRIVAAMDDWPKICDGIDFGKHMKY